MRPEDPELIITIRRGRPGQRWGSRELCLQYSITQKREKSWEGKEGRMSSFPLSEPVSPATTTSREQFEKKDMMILAIGCRA